MDYADIINSFKKDYDKLKYFGIYMNDDKISTWRRVYSFMVQVIFMGLFNLALVIDWVLSSTSLKGFISSGYLIILCILAHFKLICLYKNRKHLTKLIRRLEIESFQLRNEEELIIGRKEFNFFQKVKWIQFGITTLSILTSLPTPYLMNRHGELPFPAWYPINVSEPPAFYIAFCHQSISGMLLAYSYLYEHMLLCVILILIGLQCNVLCLRVKKLGRTGSRHESHRMLSHSVLHHQDIVRFLKTTDKVFGNIYFWQLFASAMTLCMGLFLVSLADPKTFEFYYFVVYLIAVATLLLVPCWFASEMTRKSENIPIAAYNCDWMDASDSFKKDLIFLIQRSQRPLALYAADYFEISVETFSKIIRTSLSYFAVLTNLNT